MRGRVPADVLALYELIKRHKPGDPPATIITGKDRCRTCGHERSWHAADGGPCEVGPPCECAAWDDPT